MAEHHRTSLHDGRHGGLPDRAPSRRHTVIIWALLLLAAVQCGRAIFVSNVSYLDLARYAAGAERAPYQDRVGMMPVLRWAEQNPSLARAAAAIDRSQQATPQHASHPETMSADKLACVLLGCFSVLLMTVAATWVTRRQFPDLWWIGGALVLAILYTSYAARAELNLWYPYDLPHFAIFGLATLGILEGEWALFFVCFLLDIPIRETSIYLALLGGVVALYRRQTRIAVATAAIALLVWLPSRILITRHFAHNANEVGVRWHHIAHALLDPLHWPQVASAGGFLLLPLLLGRRWLRPDQRVFLWAAAPCVAVTLIFGLWYESRIFGEWTVAVALLLTEELRRFLEGRRSETEVPRDLAVS